MHRWCIVKYIEAAIYLVFQYGINKTIEIDWIDLKEYFVFSPLHCVVVVVVCNFYFFAKLHFFGFQSQKGVVAGEKKKYIDRYIQ